MVFYSLLLYFDLASDVPSSSSKAKKKQNQEKRNMEKQKQREKLQDIGRKYNMKSLYSNK